MPPLLRILLVLTSLIAVGDKSIAVTDANFAVIYDKGDVGIETIVAKALKHSKDIVANPTVHMKTIDSSQNIEDIMDQLVKFLREHSSLNYLLDFTRAYNSSHGIRNGLIQTHFPSISITTYLNLDERRDGTEIVIVDTPELSTLAVAARCEGFFGTLVQDNFGVLAVAPYYVKSKDSDDYEYKPNLTWNLPPTRLSQTLDKYNVDVFFLIGSHEKSLRLMQEVSEYKADWIKHDIENLNSQDIPKLKSSQGTLFTSRFVWWSVSTLANEEFKCPNYAKGVVVGRVRSNTTFVETRASKHLEKYQTKNLTDLFFVDIIQISLRSFAKLSANGTGNDMTKEKKTFKIKWAKAVDSYLQSRENILGHYIFHSSVFFPNVKLSIDYATPDKVYRDVAVASFGKFVISNSPKNQTESIIDNLRTRLYIGVIVVVDPPFIFSKTKLNKDEVKDVANLPSYFGYLHDLVKIMEEEWFVTIYFVSEAPYGKFDNVTKKWSGAIGKLQNREADMILGAVEVTNERLDVVKMTTPFFTDKLNNNATYAFAFTKDFHWQTYKEFNRAIRDLQMHGVLKQLEEKWFRKTPYEYTLSKNH